MPGLPSSSQMVGNARAGHFLRMVASWLLAMKRATSSYGPFRLASLLARSKGTRPQLRRCVSLRMERGFYLGAMTQPSSSGILPNGPRRWRLQSRSIEPGICCGDGRPGCSAEASVICCDGHEETTPSLDERARPTSGLSTVSAVVPYLTKDRTRERLADFTTEMDVAMLSD